MSQRSRRGGDRTRASAHQSGGHYARGAGPYPVELVPVALPGDYIELLPNGNVYQVEAFTPQAGVKAFSGGITLAANGSDSDNQPDELKMPDGWLGQFRLVDPGADIPDGVDVLVDQGGEQKPLYTTKNHRGRFDRETGTEIGHDGSSEVAGDDIQTNFLEYYVFEDEPPYFTFEETAGATPTVQNVEFRGYHYKLSDRTNAPSDAFPVPLPVEKIE